ncbi:VWA domain-containing protein [Streptomyces sp. NPDC048362]|uniref:VWA domain-containing protein n=1 Tax=Streptomyces sp. NPDC048362 TaxID=3365539 RepID=UPI00371BF2A0
MGILTLLRNAFGRSRKVRATEAEGADRLPTQPPTPEAPATEPPAAEAAPTQAPDTEHPRIPEPAAPGPRTADIPEPRQAGPGEHDLVAAAFDHVKVPHPANPTPGETDPTPQPTPTAQTNPATEPEAGAGVAAGAEAKPGAEAEPEAAAAAEAEPKAEAEQEAVAETRTEREPEAEARTEPEPEAQTEPEAKPEPTAEAKPEAQGEVEPEPVSAPEAEAHAEPEAKPEAEANAEPEPEPEAHAEPEPDAKPEPEPDAATEPETHPEPTARTQPEPAAAPEASAPEPAAAPEASAPEPEAAAEPLSLTLSLGAGGAEPTTTDPQAADGEDAPQGPPAPDDETRTGGAGGNTDAEGEAEAPQETPAPAQAPAPATPLTEIKSRTPSLTTAYKAATTTLEKTDLTGTRAKLYLVLDRSASMRPYYKDGSAQALADQTLALAAHLDPEATVHTVFFSTEVDGTTDLTLVPDHETRIDDTHAGLGRMGRTSYHAAVEAVITHFDEHADPTTPALVVFQTDGAPDAKTPATQALTEAAATHPTVFFSFVAFGEHDNKAFDYLRKLKTGNTSFFHAGPTPRELTDTELYDGVLADWRPAQ